ncbi:MAG: sigma 54-interacting transcriptional regulator [Desulfatirhabdiaceae bacterium]
MTQKTAMFPKSLKHMLLLVVALLVVVPGVIISQLVAHRYSIGLMETAAARAENIAHNLALEAADKILINELVSLQKIFDDQIASDSSVAYLFVVRDGVILTHTFSDGIPTQLIAANTTDIGGTHHIEKIVSQKGERYIDIAYPIFDGRAGILRMGFSEAPYRHQVRQLWIRMSAITLGILVLTLGMSQWAIGRLIHPLGELTRYAEQIDVGNPDSRISVKGGQEVTLLTAAFNAMLVRLQDYTTRLKDYTGQLELKNLELERTHKQLATSLSISQKISALSGLDQIGPFLIRTLTDLVPCRNVNLLVFNGTARIVHLTTPNQIHELDPSFYDRIYDMVDRYKELVFLNRAEIDHWQLPPGLPDDVDRIALLPIRHHGMMIGGLLVACEGACSCVRQELDIVAMILHQTAGAVHRAGIHEDQLRELRQRLDIDSGLGEIVGKDPKMQVLFKLIEDVAPTDATVLIQGESGTGKELVARAIHKRSHRAQNPFVVINCSAYPTTLLESELFGHEKGAFTGAIRRKIGRFEQADGGTVFLDEISEIDPMAQTRLLRVLQQQTIDRLGGDQPIKVDVRILAATNRNLVQEVRQGRFREDLFYRLNVIPIYIPPLRERPKDIHLLARYFLDRFAREQTKTIQGFRSEVMRKLIDTPWPGNVRELENTIEHAVVLAKGNMIEFTDLPTSLIDAQPSSECNPFTIAEIEKQTIQKSLEENDWNKTEAARKLGISRSTLYEKMKKLHIAGPAS